MVSCWTPSLLPKIRTSEIFFLGFQSPNFCILCIFKSAFLKGICHFLWNTDVLNLFPDQNVLILNYKKIRFSSWPSTSFSDSVLKSPLFYWKASLRAGFRWPKGGPPPLIHEKTSSAKSDFYDMGTKKNKKKPQKWKMTCANTPHLSGNFFNHSLKKISGNLH